MKKVRKFKKILQSIYSLKRKFRFLVRLDSLESLHSSKLYLLFDSKSYIGYISLSEKSKLINRRIKEKIETLGTRNGAGC